MTGRLAGGIALVTGAASGMGATIAAAFADEGAAVGVADRDADGARRVAEKIESGGGRALALPLDVALESDCEHAIAAASQAFGALTVLVNGAGIMAPGRALDTSLESWNRSIGVNLTGAFLMAKAALPALIGSRGCIVNIASIGGVTATPGAAAYSAAKHGLIGLTTSLALDYGPDGVRVNAICPGPTQTPMTDAFYTGVPGRSADEVRADRGRSVPLGRIGQPEDIARVAVHLASDEAGWTTGQVYVLDGGASLGVRRT